MEQEGIESILFALKKSKGSSLACRVPLAGGQSGLESHIAHEEGVWKAMGSLFYFQKASDTWAEKYLCRREVSCARR